MTTFVQIAPQKAFCLHLLPRAITAADAKNSDDDEDGDEEKSSGEDLNLC